jgi:hypothetical protein
MKRMASALFLISLTLMAQEQQKLTNQEIAGAVLPLPEQLRGGSAVVRLSRAGLPEPVRKGTNGMVCIADRPGDEAFDVRCYHESFIPVVYRLFQLNAEGVKPGDLYDTIEAEVKAGKLTLPNQPTAGYRCLGPTTGINTSTNSLSKDVRCWQSIHFPFRTAHEMGLMDESELPKDMRPKCRTSWPAVGSGPTL